MAHGSSTGRLTLNSNPVISVVVRVPKGCTTFCSGHWMQLHGLVYDVRDTSAPHCGHVVEGVMVVLWKAIITVSPCLDICIDGLVLSVGLAKIDWIRLFGSDVGQPGSPI